MTKSSVARINNTIVDGSDANTIYELVCVVTLETVASVSGILSTVLHVDNTEVSRKDGIACVASCADLLVG